MLTNNRWVRNFSALCFMVYFCSYITRINFGAVVSEIIVAEGILKSSASAVITAGFIFYGIGQIFSGFLGDHIAPNRMISWGLGTTAFLNLLIPFCAGVEQMTIIWSLNGLAQSMLWPPLVRVMSEMIPSDQFGKGCVSVSIAASIGTITVYLFGPVLIITSGWRLVFFVCGTITIAAAGIWTVGFSRLRRRASADMPPTSKPIARPNDSIDIASIRKIAITSGLIYIILGIVLQGALRDGITTWIPSYLSETFQLKNSVAILMTVALPIVSILTFQITSQLQKRVFKNELACAAFLYAIGFGALLLLSFFSSFNALLSIALSSIVTGSMHGVNLMLVVMLPRRFSRFGRISGISGILNFFTYLGSALSTFCIADLIESYDWHKSILLCATAAFVGLFVCSLCVKRWSIFTSEANGV